jgi:hypothetical protein
MRFGMATVIKMVEVQYVQSTRAKKSLGGSEEFRLRW